MCGRVDVCGGMLGLAQGYVGVLDLHTLGCVIDNWHAHLLLVAFHVERKQII